MMKPFHILCLQYNIISKASRKGSSSGLVFRPSGKRCFTMRKTFQSSEAPKFGTKIGAFESIEHRHCCACQKQPFLCQAGRQGPGRTRQEVSRILVAKQGLLPEFVNPQVRQSIWPVMAHKEEPKSQFSRDQDWKPVPEAVEMDKD